MGKEGSRKEKLETVREIKKERVGGFGGKRQRGRRERNEEKHEK